MQAGRYQDGKARTCSFVRDFPWTLIKISTLPTRGVGVICAACLSLVLVGCGSDDSNTLNTSPQAGASFVRAQKGPFQSGSKVVLYELDVTGQRTGRTTITTTAEAGLFIAEPPWVGATEAEVTGYYFDESSGTYREEPGTLTGWIDIPSAQTQCVNLFGSFALARMRNLVGAGQTVDVARVTAFNELRTLFDLRTENPEAIAYLDLTDGTGPWSVDNANLLLFSTALMVAGSQQNDIDNLRTDFADDGIINGIAMQIWIRTAVYAGVLDMASAKTSLETLPGVIEAPDFTTLGSIFPGWVNLAGDADSDGLSDQLEVLVEGSDPLLSDTDGDTYSDSYELGNGGDPNDALSLPLAVTSTPVSDGETGFDYSYAVQTTWSGESFFLDTAPSGMSIDTVSGVIRWTPSLAQLGNFSISVRVMSGAYSVSQAYVLTTMNGNTGDINEDGAIDGKDVLLSERISLGLVAPSAVQMIRADVIADGSIQGNDIIMIQRQALGL